MNFVCPPPTSLTALPLAAACAFKFDQIIRSAFQRIQAEPPFNAAAPITAKASWVALMGLTSSKKIVVSPVFAGMVIPTSEGKETGGNDNTTPFGIPSYGGEGSVKVDYVYTNQTPAMIAGLRKFSQESIPLLGTYALTNYWFNIHGDIIANVPKGYAADEYAGIPIFNHRVGSIASEGLNADNKNNSGFYLPPYWDETIAMISGSTLDFNPLSDL